MNRDSKLKATTTIMLSMNLNYDGNEFEHHGFFVLFTYLYIKIETKLNTNMDETVHLSVDNHFVAVEIEMLMV